MKLVKIGIAALLSLAAAISFAETAQETAVRKLLIPRLGEDAKIDSVRKTPYSGLYEVRTNGDILYTDEKAQYMFAGHVIDTTTHTDFTKERLEEINKIAFSDLPLNLALKAVKGNGKRSIAIFEDPNCGYCKQLRRSLQDVDNVTIYTFMFNILSPESAVKSKNIWCMPDHAKAWDDWMLNGKAPAPAPDSCTTAPNEQVLELGHKLKINGTPAIFFTDGSRIPGAVDAKGLEAKLASVK
jgi:thiol:disulfide interchange protein DsbC